METLIPDSIKTWLNFFHPLLMWVLFGLTIYALYLGIKAKKIRTADAETRKELIKGKFNVRHHQMGALLLALMVIGTIGGMAVTYINNGKLFVGPHLLVGLGMTGLIAVSASLTPLMQKGSVLARKIHVALNMSLVLLFGWQAVSGMQIVQKIVDNIMNA
ncbi:MAG: DUF4079 domain-containing protein [Leptolyngbyaceae bacterium]|nr:DUF4079 domain-containing protein [Leptolyngbyaceae bacterium]